MGSPVVPLPPKGYQLNVQPPKGYLPDNSDVPTFLKQGVDLNQVKQSVVPDPPEDKDRRVISYVEPDKPYAVDVVRPDLYGPPVYNHELTHTFQLTRNPDLAPIAAPTPLDTHSQLATRGAYDYGGVEGLQNARNAHKTISDFNNEQQAEIVKDYKALQDKYLAKARAGKITDDDKKAMYKAHEAYHPLVSQLAAMPGKDVNLGPSLVSIALGRNLPTIDTTPAAPGLPDYSVKGLGVLPADPLLGGRSVSVPTPSQKPRKKDTTPVKSK